MPGTSFDKSQFLITLGDTHCVMSNFSAGGTALLQYMSWFSGVDCIKGETIGAHAIKFIKFGCVLRKHFENDCRVLFDVFNIGL